MIMALKSVHIPIVAVVMADVVLISQCFLPVIIVNPYFN